MTLGNFKMMIKHGYKAVLEKKQALEGGSDDIRRPIRYATSSRKITGLSCVFHTSSGGG